MTDRRDFLAALAAGGASLLGAGRLTLPADFTADGRYPLSDPTSHAPLAPADFLFDEGITYLNTAALGPAPRQVLDRVIDAWKILEGNPSQQGYGPLEYAMDDVRARAARLLGCATPELVLTTSTTDGMNIVAQGLGLRTGDRVLTSDQEHPGGVSCWKYLQRRNGVAMDIIPIAPSEHDADTIVSRFEKAIRPETRVISVSHVLTSTGVRMPIAGLSALTRRRGLTIVVDGAQAVGGIDVDVKALGCHAYATSGHKWLMGPKGTGLLYLADETRGTIDPMRLEGGHQAYTASSGVVSLPLVHGLGTAIDLALATGMPAIERSVLALRDHLYDELRSMRGVEIVSPPPIAERAPFVTVRLPAARPAATVQKGLQERHRVYVKVVPAEWLNGLRISTHVFNSTRQVTTFVKALQAELG